MKRLMFLLFASILVLSACGNDEEKKEEPKKETKSEEKKVDKEKKEEKKKEVVKKPQQQSDENSQEQTIEQNQQTQQQAQNYDPQQETPVVDKNTVTEYYNGQSHTTTNNPVKEEYVEGETDPIYEREYKRFYTEDEARRAQENSDAILREMGLEPGHYE